MSRTRTGRRNRTLAAAAAGALCLTGLVACGDGSAGTGGTSSGSPSGTTAPSTTSGSTTPAVTGTSTPAPATSTTTGTRAVPVYYLADYAGALRLYREFHALPVPQGAARAALTEMFRDTAVDPDYVSLWPTASKVVSYTVSGGVATVDLNAAAGRNANSGSEGEELSVQQLVYTVTAADPTVKKVVLKVAGKTVSDLWGHGAVGTQPLSRAPRIEVQGLIWILAPTQGASVGSPVTVKVLGTAFEGSTRLAVYRGKTEVAAKVVLTQMGDFAEAKASFTLPTGSYTVRAADENAQDGGWTERDSKAFTVS